MPTVDFPHVSKEGKEGGRSGFTQQLLQGLRLAALLTEPPEHRLARLAEERRERESQFGMAQDQERTAIARQREARESQEDSRRREREDLSTKLELASRGVQLSPQQRAQMASGELLGLDLGHGVNVGPDGGSIAEYGGDAFFIPGRQAQADLDLQAELDKVRSLEEERAKVKRTMSGLPFIGKLEDLKQYFPDTDRATPEEIRALSTAMGLTQEEPPDLDKTTFTNENDEVFRVFINPQTGEKKEVLLGKTKGAKAAGKSGPTAGDLRNRVTEMASGILLENGNDPKRAIADLERQARFDESGFIRKNLTAIRGELQKLDRRQEGGLVGEAFGEESAPSGSSAGSNPADEFEAYLRERGGG